jgi:hypothetical protein
MSPTWQKWTNIGRRARVRSKEKGERRKEKGERRKEKGERRKEKIRNRFLLSRQLVISFSIRQIFIVSKE